MDVQLADLAQSAAARTAARGVVEREGIGVAHEGLPDAREEQTQQGVDVGVGAHRGAGVGGRLALFDDDGDGQVLDVAHVWPPVLGQVLLREGGEGVVEFPSRLGRDGVQHQRRLPRPRHARHYGDFPLGNPDVDVLEVVLRGIADDDVGEVVIGFHLFHSVQFLAAIDLNRQRYDIFLKHGMVMRSRLHSSPFHQIFPNYAVVWRKIVFLRVEIIKKAMIQGRTNNSNDAAMQGVFLNVPVDDWALLQELIRKFGWQSETREQLLDRFCSSRPQQPTLTDEEIMEEVKAVRYGK